MKKIVFSFVLTSVFLAFFTACSQDFSIPHGLQVKTEAQYNFTVAEIEKDLSEYISAEKMSANIGSSGFEFYDYNPGGNQKTQSFLLRMPIQEIPLDFSSYLENMDIGKNLEAMSFEQEIAVPNVNLNKTQQIDTTVLNDVLCGLMTISSTTDGQQKPQKVNFGNFGTVVVQSGSMVLGTNASGKVSLYSGADLSTPALAQAATPICTATISNGTVSLPLSGKTIYGNGTYICFEDETSSGLAFAGSLVNGKISKATGVTANTSEIDLGNQTFPIKDSTSGLEECVFGTGSTITLAFEPPASWTNVTVDQNVTFTGGLNLSFTSSAPQNVENKVLKNEDINASIKVTLKLANADIVISDKPSMKLSSDITKIASLTASVPDGVVTDINVNKSLDSGATDMINKIVWEPGCGIKVSYVNTFPAENDFSLTGVQSTFLGLNSPGAAKNIAGGTVSPAELSFVTDTETTTTLSSPTNVDFKAKLGLPNQAANKFTVKNVEPGKSYKIKIDITPVFNWKSLEVKMDNLTGLNNTGSPTQLDMNPTKLLGELDTALKLTAPNTISDKLKLSSLKISLFCEKPDISLFNSAQFHGTIKIKGGANTAYLLNNEDMTFVPEPELRKNDKGSVVSTVSGGVTVDLAPVLNSMASTDKLEFSYDLGLSTGESGPVIINKADLENSTATSMKITAIMILPLDFVLNTNGAGKFEIDLLKIADKTFVAGDKDLLGRSEATPAGESNEYLKIIDSVTVAYTSTKIPVNSSKPVSLIIDLDEANPDSSKRGLFGENVLSLKGGSYTENPNKVLENLIYPKMVLRLQDGTISLPREMAFKTRLDLAISTNGEPLDLWGGN